MSIADLLPEVPSIQSEEEWNKLLSECERVVCHFWAPWCPPCLQLQEVMRELALEHQAVVKFVQIEAERVAPVSISNNILAVPTFVLYKRGEEFRRVDGAHAAELTKKVEVLADALPRVEAAGPKPRDVKEACKSLIESADVMLFMKGSGDDPKCRFSKRMVEMLNEKSVHFSTYDILLDTEVREGLKEYSNWPTYPQLYHKGELLGGVDIVEALNKSGELDNLPKREKLQDKIKRLITSHRIMLFMKGDPQTPECKFSRATIEIMNETELPYGSFNILGDEAVRQGLKEYSDWPTYPQLYVRGEFVGGLDILRSLKETGELETTLKAS